MEEKKVKPIIITDNETGDEYTLEFTRETVKYAEARGFNLDDIDKFPMTKTEELFYYAFKAHHKGISPSKVNEILWNDLGGMPEGMVGRLAELYVLPFNSMKQNEGETKNSKMSVVM